jgi:hypothetical protein
MTDRHIHWTELYGNKEKYSLHPRMLKEDGYKKRSTVPVRGESKSIPQDVIIIFDESYVITKLRRIIDQLYPYDYAQLEKVIKKAWNEERPQQAVEIQE